jgi:ATP-dependent helicase/nuclease subunit B
MATVPPKLFTIPAGVPFAAALAQGAIARFGAEPLSLADIAIYLPTQRAARAMGEVFAREMGGAALLPDFRALGGVDEDEAFFDPSTDDPDLRPAMEKLRRRLLLAAAIRRWSLSRDGGRLGFIQAASLAKSLALVMDEVETQGADLAKLDDLAPASLAEHWAEVKDFLSLMRGEWPKLLAAEDRINPAAHRDAALRALAKRLRENPPDKPVIAAGSTGSVPATTELIAVIARLPKGAVVLPGLDRDLDEDSWQRLDAGHPQYGMKELLARIGAERRDVADWAEPASPARAHLLREVLRPAPTTDAWRALAETGGGDMAVGLDGLSLIEAGDAAEEASAVALLLREALETKGQTAALVTRDRALARRVSAELGRWNIAIDDSAGRPLSQTPPGTFLCLLAEAADDRFAPVPLLALLKHPLCAPDEDIAAFRAKARELDLALRGPRPDAGLAGIASALHEKPSLAAWFARVADMLAPLERALAQVEISIGEALDAHLATAARLSQAKALWAGPSGKEASAFVEALREAAADLPDIEPGAYAPMIRTLMGEVAVRPPYGRHPRLAILGPLEARLQSFDLVVLGGLNEGSWPASAADDPWFSRPMRKTLGLEQPERAIGLSAHDFASLAANKRAVLTRALKADGTPTVASRWLQRLKQLTGGLGLEERLNPVRDYLGIASQLRDAGAAEPAAPPYPRPPVAARPRRLSVTEIETWLRDPYAIYARRVLKLRPLDPLDAEIGPLEKGNALHRALELFVREYPRELPADAARRLIEIADEVFAQMHTPKAALALWRPRFLAAAQWFAEEERARRAGIADIFVEIKGERVFAAPQGDFILAAKADRIDRLKAGGAAILDYKTGSPPSDAQVLKHLSPQLPLEAAILMAGGFAAIGAEKPEALVYVRIGSARDSFHVIDGDAEALAREAAERLARRVALFDDPAIGYSARVAPFRADKPGDYDHLARVREWAPGGWRGE